MLRYALTLTALTTLLVMPLEAQSSEFGIRGLGLPGRGMTAKARSTGGGLSMFEGESSLNPAALTLLNVATTVLTGIGSWRSSVNPAGKASTYDARFPQLSVGGPIPGRELYVGISNSLFTDRDFTAVSHGSENLRGIAVPYTDSVSSRGGINDLRLSVAWHPVGHFAVGGGIDFLTGQNQLTTRRLWSDSLYLPARLTGEVSFQGLGLTGGVLYQPNSKLQLAASGQYLGSLNVQQDSQPKSQISMPMTLNGAARMQFRSNMRVNAAASYRTWSRADAELLAGGGTGAQNTLDLSAGLEIVRSAASPDHLPLRLGIRHGDLPFALVTGEKVSETAYSVGSGIRFARQGGGIDLSLERISRKQGALYTESGWHLAVTVTVRTRGGER